MKNVWQFARFLVAGGVGLLVLLGVTYMLTEILNWWYFWSYILATLVSWTCIFLINSLFTFVGHRKDGYTRKYLSFLLMYVGVFAINATIVYTLTSVAGLPYLLSIIGATAFTTIITFTLSKYHIFTYGN